MAGRSLAGWAVTAIAIMQQQLDQSSRVLALSRYGRFIARSANRAEPDAAATQGEADRKARNRVSLRAPLIAGAGLESAIPASCGPIVPPVVHDPPPLTVHSNTAAAGS